MEKGLLSWPAADRRLDSFDDPQPFEGIVYRSENFHVQGAVVPAAKDSGHPVQEIAVDDKRPLGHGTEDRTCRQ